MNAKRAKKEYDPIFEEHNESEFIKWIESGGDVRLRGPANRTLLIYALERKMFAAVPLLMSKGINPNLKTNGSSALLNAIQPEIPEDIFFTIVNNSKHPIQYSQRLGKSYLIHEAVYSRLDVVEYLLEHGVDPDQIVANSFGVGIPLLSYAIDRGNEALVRILLKYKANPNTYGDNHSFLDEALFKQGWYPNMANEKNSSTNKNGRER